MKTKTFSIRIPISYVWDLKHIAKDENRSVNQLIAFAIARFILSHAKK